MSLNISFACVLLLNTEIINKIQNKEAYNNFWFLIKRKNAEVPIDCNSEQYECSNQKA